MLRNSVLKNNTMVRGETMIRTLITMVDVMILVRVRKQRRLEVSDQENIILLGDKIK